MSDTLTRSVGRAVLASLLAVTATAAAAADNAFVIKSPEGVTRSVAVKFADLDLNTTHGQARLDWRVEQAARTACDMHRGSVVDKLPGATACLEQARTSAYAMLESRGIVGQRLASR